MEDDAGTQEQCPQPTSSSSPALNVERRQSQTSPNAQQGHRRALTAASALVPSGQSLPPHHPALSLTAFFNCFGPLIFPLYKAALLRKRILLVGQAPVELACNYGKPCLLQNKIVGNVSGSTCNRAHTKHIMFSKSVIFRTHQKFLDYTSSRFSQFYLIMLSTTSF